MSRRALKKLITSNPIRVFLMINLMLFLPFFLTGLFRRKSFANYSQMDFAASTSNPNQSMTSTPVESRNIKLSPLIIRKIEQLKRELNDSVLTNEDLFPANRIGRYLLLDPNLCSGVHHVDIIIIVHTAPANLEKRQRIRDSFAQAALFRPFEIRIAFLLGKTSNKTLERILWIEHVRYNDTVMGDFIDDYHNLSLKGVMGFRWVSQHCPNSEFVLKIDDDVLVNMFKLLYSFLNHMSGKKKSIFCNFWYDGTMAILRQGKWKVDSHVFSSRKTFPYDYCSGFIVIMTSDLVKALYEAALRTPFFWIDDVYLFGMLPFVVGNVTYYNYALDKALALDEKKAMNCTQTQGPRCPIFGTLISNKSYWTYWNMITEIYTSTNWKVKNKVVH